MTTGDGMRRIFSLYFANPLKDRPAFFDGLCDTHPPIAERIRRLEAMG